MLQRYERSEMSFGLVESIIFKNSRMWTSHIVLGLYMRVLKHRPVTHSLCCKIGPHLRIGQVTEQKWPCFIPSDVFSSYFKMQSVFSSNMSFKTSWGPFLWWSPYICPFLGWGPCLLYFLWCWPCNSHSLHLPCICPPPSQQLLPKPELEKNEPQSDFVHVMFLGVYASVTWIYIIKHGLSTAKSYCLSNFGVWNIEQGRHLATVVNITQLTQHSTATLAKSWTWTSCKQATYCWAPWPSHYASLCSKSWRCCRSRQVSFPEYGPETKSSSKWPKHRQTLAGSCSPHPWCCFTVNIQESYHNRCFTPILPSSVNCSLFVFQTFNWFASIIQSTPLEGQPSSNREVSMSNCYEVQDVDMFSPQLSVFTAKRLILRGTITSSPDLQTPISS